MLTVRLLGTVEIEREGVSRPYGARKYAILLALLALEPHRVFSRSELVAALWPESDEREGRGALRSALTALRDELGAECLATTRETVTLADGLVTTDVAALETCLRRIQEATTADGADEVMAQIRRLNRGPLLPGSYDDWVVAARERIESRVQAAHNRCDVLRRTLEKEWPPPGKRATLPARLPLFTTRFFGREGEMDALAALFADPTNRLVTLTGTGGVGKTRLAVEVARTVANRFPGGVYFVPLAASTTGEEILPEAGRALSVESPFSEKWEDALARRLESSGRVLLVLDNAEQLVDHGAALAVRRLLSLAPTLAVLVTSRRVLGVEGERVFALEGLPEGNGRLLFEEQARYARPDFAVTEANREVVGLLCARLEGLPLAIELCAAWVSVLTPQQIVGKMEDRFALLKSRRQDVLPRHRSLHAALEWGVPSDPETLAFFLALSAFRGGFTLEAAEAVAGGDALERLAMLREHSLLVAEAQADGTMRYRLLETIREFADERLEGDARLALSRRHLSYFHDLAANVTPLLLRADAPIHYAALERENANFKAAIEFGLTDTVENVGLAHSAIELLRWFWGMRGHRMPLRQWLETTFHRRDDLPPLDRAWLLVRYGRNLPTEQAEGLCREALALFEAHGNAAGVSQVYEGLGDIRTDQGNVAEMDDYYRRAAAVRESVGDVRGVGYVLAALAGGYFRLGDGESARLLWKQCRTISESLGDIGSLAVLDRAEAFSLIRDGRHAEALPLLESALATFRLKGETWHVMDTLERYGYALFEAGRPEQAAETLAEAITCAEQWGDPNRAALIRKNFRQLLPG